MNQTRTTHAPLTHTILQHDAAAHTSRIAPSLSYCRFTVIPSCRTRNEY
jgi:hypothetical protein